MATATNIELILYRSQLLRADGNGGTMARGWHVIYGDGSKAGPFAGKRAAVDYRMGILPRSDYSKGN